MIVRKIKRLGHDQPKRVAAYCRVSTDKPEQEESYGRQVSYYTQMIEGNPAWVFAGIYADQGKSGTSASKRPEFQRMLQAAQAREIDIILVKSISRFARNVVDCQKIVQQLKDIQVEVRFEREHISSFDPSSGFVFSLLSAIAQDESRSISENVRWGYTKRFKQGKYCLGNNRLLGYDTVDGKLVPNQDAWVVRRIFDLFVQGKTYAEIEQTILREGGVSLRKKGAITLSTLQYIVRNEAYVGDKRLQKKAPVNYLTKRPDPTIPYETYYLQDDHEPIISRETWNQAQALLTQRDNERKKGVIRRGEHHVFYGKLFCAECGAPYTRRTLRECEQRGSGQYKAWNCKERQKGRKGNGCKNRILRESELQEQIAAQLGWDAFDEERFQREVHRAEVGAYGFHIEHNEECA